METETETERTNEKEEEREIDREHGKVTNRTIKKNKRQRKLLDKRGIVQKKQKWRDRKRERERKREKEIKKREKERNTARSLSKLSNRIKAKENGYIKEVLLKRNRDINRDGSALSLRYSHSRHAYPPLLCVQ